MKTQFVIKINYKESIEKAVAKGNYDYKNSNINTKNFSGSAKNYIDPSLNGPVTVTIKLFHFNETLKTDQALDKIDQAGYRPANLYELLALGAQRLRLQREISIVGLGSSWLYPHGDRSAPYLNWGSSGRYLRLGWTDHRWSVGWRFAAVSKDHGFNKGGK